MNESATPTIPARPVPVRDGSRLVSGDRVDVRNRFDGSWCSGFEIADITGAPAHPTYRIRRLSDGEVLPHLFEGASVAGTRTGGPGSWRPLTANPSSSVHGVPA